MRKRKHIVGDGMELIDLNVDKRDGLSFNFNENQQKASVLDDETKQLHRGSEDNVIKVMPLILCEDSIFRLQLYRFTFLMVATCNLKQKNVK